MSNRTARAARRLEQRRAATPPPKPPTGPCCRPVLVVTFRNQQPVAVEHRHFGAWCLGHIDRTPVAEWLAVKGLTA